MSTSHSITLSCGDYDINHALATGEIRPQGLDLTVLLLRSPERHARMALHREFDVCEMSMATFLAMWGGGDRSVIAIPAFPHRRFRHGFIFVPENSKITDPSELNGGRVGLRTWQTTAGLWARGILQDDHAVDLRSVQWFTQDAEDVPFSADFPFSITRVAEGDSVVEMLQRGELDALIYPELPKGAGEPGSGIRRLFPDPKAAEIDYFRRSGIFPIMHTVVIRRELVERLPWAARELLEAFRASKDRAFERMQDPRRVSLAWLREALAEQARIMGPDPWSYELDANRTPLETVIRYGHEQGMLPSLIAPAELFAPSTVEELPSYV
jgi:4,5-dihydroxyphthalate decarboxylase